MGKGRGVRIAILAEDRLSERFARRVLMDLGYERHELRFVADGRPDSGQGSAKQWIDQQYPVQVKTYRKEKNNQSIGLLIATDADNQTVQERSGALEKALRQASLQARADREKIAHWIPRWSVETWGIALTGGDATEEIRYKNTPQAKDIDWKAAASAFVEDYRKPPADRVTSLPSLVAAYHETDRLT